MLSVLLYCALALFATVGGVDCRTGGSLAGGTVHTSNARSPASVGVGALRAAAARGDGIAPEEVPVAMDTIRVTRRPLVDATISPLQCGQFIEYLANLVGGMWAEKLYDTSFEGLSPYNVAFIRETDFREKPWYPSGQVNRAQFGFDEAAKVSGTRSQRIAVTGGPPCVVGISQDGVFVTPGVADTFSCWLKQDGIGGQVTVRLHGEARTYAMAELTPDGTWRKFSAKLAARTRDTNATLSIEFRGPGTLWIDNASLMPDDAVDGWRADVVEAVRALKPGVIRFGGSAVDYADAGDYDWRKTIGDPDHRAPFRAWGGLQPMGAGLEEIVRFCRLVHAEPLICVRFIGSTPEEAAAQVEYFNGSPDTPMGRLRARNGHREPYDVRYWQVGNEVRSDAYDAGISAFCEAMKKADPSIVLLSSYPTPAVVRNAGALIDYVCPHHYACADLHGMAADVEAIRAMIRENAPDRPIKIAVTEWNTTAGDWGTGRATLWTLANALACARYHNFMHRRCDIVEIANRSNLTNSFCSGIIQTDNHRLFKTPTYYAQQFYATLAGDQPLAIEPPMQADTGVDVSAMLSPDGKHVTLFAVNDGLAAEDRTLDLSAFDGGRREIDVWTLADSRRAGEPDAANSFADPTRIAPKHARRTVAGPRFRCRFAPLSLTVVRW